MLFPSFTLCLVQDLPDERDRMAHEKPEVRGAVKSNSEDRLIELEAQNIRLQRDDPPHYRVRASNAIGQGPSRFHAIRF